MTHLRLFHLQYEPPSNKAIINSPARYTHREETKQANVVDRGIYTTTKQTSNYSFIERQHSVMHLQPIHILQFPEKKLFLRSNDYHSLQATFNSIILLHYFCNNSINTINRYTITINSNQTFFPKAP